MLQPGLHSLQAWNLFCVHMQALDAIYQSSTNVDDVYFKVKSCGEHGDLFFLWQWQREQFEDQYFKKK